MKKLEKQIQELTDRFCKDIDDCLLRKRKRDHDSLISLCKNKADTLKLNPFFAWPHRLARSRTSDFHSANRGSNPLGVNIRDFSSVVEHLTFNERVDGSNPSSLNFQSKYTSHLNNTSSISSFVYYRMTYYIFCTDRSD